MNCVAFSFAHIAILILNQIFRRVLYVCCKIKTTRPKKGNNKHKNWKNNNKYTEMQWICIKKKSSQIHDCRDCTIHPKKKHTHITNGSKKSERFHISCAHCVSPVKRKHVSYCSSVTGSLLSTLIQQFAKEFYCFQPNIVHTINNGFKVTILPYMYRKRSYFYQCLC